MSKTGKKILTAFILMVCLAAGAVAVYYYISSADSDNTNEKTEPGTEVEKLLDKDLDTKYPETPVEVLKLYWRFNKCMYNEKMSDSEFEELLKQLRKLYDEEFLAIEENSWENMLGSFKKDRDEYGRETVSINCNALIKQKAKRINVYEEFMCRRDNDNNWKILGWKKTDAGDGQNEDAK